MRNWITWRLFSLVLFVVGCLWWATRLTNKLFELALSVGGEVTLSQLSDRDFARFSYSEKSQYRYPHHYGECGYNCSICDVDDWDTEVINNDTAGDWVS